MIPTPYYTLVNTSRGKDPAVVVVNSALRDFGARETFPWHLKISIACKLVGVNGMPTSNEADVLVRLEEILSSALADQENALFLARITCRGERELLYRVHDPEVADGALQEILAVPVQLREWDYRMEQDLAWKLASPELRLIEKDHRFS